MEHASRFRHLPTDEAIHRAAPHETTFECWPERTDCIMLIGFESAYRSEIRAVVMALGINVLQGTNVGANDRPSLIIANGGTYGASSAKAERQAAQRMFPNAPLCILNKHMMQDLSFPTDLFAFDNDRAILEAAGFHFFSIV